MEKGARNPNETPEDFVRRHYTVQWTDGRENEERLARATQAVLEANPSLDKDWHEANLPQIERIPRLQTTIDNEALLHHTVHKALAGFSGDRRLMLLSFIDPLRLGCEELGIATTPEVAASVRERLRGHVSFDQEAYEAVRRGDELADGIESIRWVRCQ